jgi:hypothetical protein
VELDGQSYRYVLASIRTGPPFRRGVVVFRPRRELIGTEVGNEIISAFTLLNEKGKSRNFDDRDTA